MDEPKARTPVSVQQPLSLEAPLFPLSSRPERSAVERSLCGCSSLEMFFDRAKRSGGTCGFFPPYSLRFAPAAAARRFDVQDVALGQVLAAFAG